jgi:hypothetical protein
MKGQPAGLYLEALRQAAVLRDSVRHVDGVTDPVEIAMQPAMVKLPVFLEWLDAVAWNIPSGSPNEGWVADPSDFSGDASTPAVLDSEADILAATGHATRISLPASLHGGVPAAYLGQLYDVLRVKTCYGKLVDMRNGNNLFCSISTVNTWANCVAAWEAGAGGTWNSTSAGDIYSYIRQTDPGAAIVVYRKAAYVTWAAPSGVHCAAADIYLMTTDYSGLTWEETDYGSSAKDTWQMIHAARDIGTGLAEYVGKLLTVTLTNTVPSYHGYTSRYAFLLANFGTSDWALGA